MIGVVVGVAAVVVSAVVGGDELLGYQELGRLVPVVVSVVCAGEVGWLLASCSKRIRRRAAIFSSHSRSSFSRWSLALNSGWSFLFVAGNRLSASKESGFGKASLGLVLVIGRSFVEGHS